MLLTYGEITPRGYLNEQHVLGPPPEERSYEERRLAASPAEPYATSSDASAQQWSAVSRGTSSHVSPTFGSAFNPAPSRFRNRTAMVELRLTDDEESRWLVHEDLLTQESERAKAALSPDGQEQVEASISIPEAVAEDVDVFVEYIYSWHVEPSRLPFDQLLSLSVMADYLVTPTFQQLILDDIMWRSNFPMFRWTAEQIQYVMASTVKADPDKVCLRNHVQRQVADGVLTKKYKFQSAEEKELLEPYMGDLFQGVVEQVQGIKLE